jgi:glycosyltransferase involved in cell wall biosynthesis
MPVRNEAAYIRSAVGSILEQNYPADCIEVFVIDGDSKDETRNIILEFQKNHHNIHLIHNPQRIVPTGMNLALPKTKGEIILRVDGHCIIAKDYIRNCVNHILFDHVDGVGGPMQTIGETPLSKVIAVAMSSSFGVGGSAFRTVSGKTILVDTVPFPAYTRDIVIKAGAYDEELVRNQDDEYNYRIREVGGKILLAGDVQSKYYSRGSLAKLWKQYFQYGYWKVRVFQKHPLQMSVRQFIPLLFVGSLIFLLLLAPFLYWGRLLFACVVAAYLSANLIASVLTAGKCGWKHFPALPICYAILHLSYGTGVLTGLVKFINRWGDKKGKVPELRFIHASRS